MAHGLDLDAAGARPGPDQGRGPTQAHPSHRDLGTEPLPRHPPSQPPDRATLSRRRLTDAPRPEPTPRAQADGYADHRPGRDLAAGADRHPVGWLWRDQLEVVHVTLTDGEGGTGTGFTFSVSGGAVAMRTLVDGVIGQATVGSELEGWERRWHGLWARTHRLGRGVAVPALSAVDIAVWDLRARRAGCPCTGCWAPTATRSRPTAAWTAWPR